MVSRLQSRKASPFAAVLLGTTVLAGIPADLAAQVPTAAPAAGPASAPAAGPAAAPDTPTAPAPPPAPAIPIKAIEVRGAERLEPQTVLSYTQLRIGQPYTQALADQALKDLFATELFADVQIRNNAGNVVIEVKENPVINRILFEGNKHLKEDKISPEIKVAPRQIFTRSKVRADVERIIELYKRQGRFAATVEPKMVQLDQNRVDIVFEITEGSKSRVRQINIIGNKKFSESELRTQMVTKQARFFRLFSSGTSYDPDRLAYDQQKLRQFYLTNGYADFRVVSAVAELTPDKKDFIITYVVEEGQRYKFGDTKVQSQLRDFSSEALTKSLPKEMHKGQWYDAKLVEDTLDRLNETAGAFGYAFADARPEYKRDPKNLTMGVNFVVADAPRVYVERIDVNGNTLTQDKVVRREFRLAEGDAFSSLQVKRSTNRIKSLGYFQEKFEVEQKPGSAPDRIILEANVEEKPTGQLQLSAGYSSIESFIFQASIEQNNFRGRGQTVGLSGSYSAYTRSVEASFTEPYLFDKNMSLGVDIYRRDLNSFNFNGETRNTTYQQATTGFQIRTGVPLTEYVTAVARYTLNYDDVSLDQATYYTNGQCDPILAGRYLCDAIGKRLSSIVGGSLIYDTLDNRVHPTRGRVASLGVDFAGLGGDVHYARLTGKASQYWNAGHGFIFSLSGEAGAIKPIGNNGAVSGEDSVRLTDRFFLGEPQIRGFDIRGVGPRVIRKTLVAGPGGVMVPSTDRNQWVDDAIGGRYYYLARAEMEIPLGSGAKELGLRPSIFADMGAVFGVKKPTLVNQDTNTSDANYQNQGLPTYEYTQTCGTTTKIGTNTTGVLPKAGNGCGDATLVQSFQEFYYGNSPKPRLSVGIGVNWNSPFGPFRIDIAKALLKQPGDDTKLFTFNVGTQF